MDCSLNAKAAPDQKDYRTTLKPVWCPGCGDFSVLMSITRAMAELGLQRHETALISGIGCSSRIPAYTSVYGFHGVHGRALAIATGVKVARPDLTVIAAGGDGDGFSIGGNHFLHSCRRNVDMTYIVMDNEVYGMTKGQASPTTDSDWKNSKLTPEGTGVSPVEPVHLAIAAGANFVARGFSGDPNEVARLIAAGIRHPGFSFVHILSPCVTYRPEQRDWKTMVHKDERPPASTMPEALHRLAEDDGFSVGILFAGKRPPFQPSLKATGSLAEIEGKYVA
ncbi:MAG: 2-oxoacid:ferredoxin oxidoreductase subunit beta [Alphaproteobacteria bacterium]|nr:2-oxoacid:ferredoxin oxidoreductase subunit beta [Alphaproteobacteria bacterium]